MRPVNSIYMFINDNKKSILIFLIVGTLTAIVNIASFSFFWKLTKISYNYAVSIAYILSVAFHFTANRYFTFNNRDKHFSLQIIKYSIVVIMNYIVTLTIVHITVETLGLSPYVGIVSAITIITILSYLVAKFWVFQGEI